MNLFKRYYLIAENKEPLLEDIYSGKAVVYHRTNQEDLINLIFKHGYKPKDRGIMYGMGMYATYDLKEQIDSEYTAGMKYKYGPIIVKLMINSINNFLILDYSEFIKTNLFKKLKSKKKTFIIDQLKYFNFHLLAPLKYLKLTKQKYDVSSYNLTEILDYFYGDFMVKKAIDGVIFTAPDEGKNVVCYNTDLIIPLSFSLDEGKTWIKAKKDKNYLKKVFSQYTDDIKLKSKKDAEVKFWIEDAKISEDAEFSMPPKFSYDIKYNNKINWSNGTWYEGTWLDGYWLTGTWKKGTWLDGTWKGGTWEYGTWKDGNFLDGTWLDGIWEKGIWLDGTWKNGTWEGGTWLGGYDKYGNYHPKGDSPDKWKI